MDVDAEGACAMFATLLPKGNARHEYGIAELIDEDFRPAWYLVDHGDGPSW